MLSLLNYEILLLISKAQNHPNAQDSTFCVLRTKIPGRKMNLIFTEFETVPLPWRLIFHQISSSGVNNIFFSIQFLPGKFLLSLLMLHPIYTPLRLWFPSNLFFDALVINKHPICVNEIFSEFWYLLYSNESAALRN